MKGFLILFLLVFSVNLLCSAQNIYSKENLERASTEDLYLYLTKAQKLKKTGRILLISAPVSGITGVLLWTDAWRGGTESELNLGTGLIFASLGALIIGIPVFATGSSRVKSVSNVWNAKNNALKIDIIPSSFFNYQAQHIQPGISIRIRF